MNRLPTMIVAFICALLALSPLTSAPAATKKSSTKKTSTSAKKKAVTSTTKKKKPPAKVQEPEVPVPTNKPDTTVLLDLPLPAKITSLSGEDGSVEKRAPEVPAAVMKPVEKTDGHQRAKREPTANATIEPDDLAEFATQPPRVQQLLRDAIDLTRLNLAYTPGSHDLDSGGMDGAGTIFYLLRAHGFNDAAQDSASQYLWARKSGDFYPVLSQNVDSVEFNELLPGDLMFWAASDLAGNEIPGSMVMLYLGREKTTGQRIMFGASEGRGYRGTQRRGVSVYDFEMAKLDSTESGKSQVGFVGYARLPGLRSALTPSEPVITAPVAKDPPKPKAKTKTVSAPKKKGTRRKSK